MLVHATWERKRMCCMWVTWLFPPNWTWISMNLLIFTLTWMYLLSWYNLLPLPDLPFEHHEGRLNYLEALLCDYNISCNTERWFWQNIHRGKFSTGSLFLPNRQSDTTQLALAYTAAVAGDTIYAYPETYTEKLTISKWNITLVGSTYPSLNPSSYTAERTYSAYASAAGSDDASATLLISGNNFKMYNMNITNSAGTAGKAAALSMGGFYEGIYAVGLKRYQDTANNHARS